MPDNSKKDEAHAQFKKVQRAEDGKKAMSEYESAGAAVRAKTERLKALRLARDAAENTAPRKETASAKNKGTASAKKKPAGKDKGQTATLSEWLTDRHGSGRNR